jgi:hypothetical protein
MKINSYYFLVELYIMFSTYGIENYGAADFNGFRNDVMDRHQGYLNKESALRQINVLAKSNKLAAARQQFAQGTAMVNRGVEIASTVPTTALAAQAVANRVSTFARTSSTLANETGEATEGIELQDVGDTAAVNTTEDITEDVAEDAVADSALGVVGLLAGAVQLGFGLYSLFEGDAEEEKGKTDETAAEGTNIQPPRQQQNYAESYVAPVSSVV